MAKRIVEVWRERLPEAELMEFLDEHGLDVRLANRMSRVWGSQAKAMAMENPYYMLAFSGWSIVDAAAAKLGVSRDDPRRLVGAVESSLYDRLQRAHTLTGHRMLYRLVQRKIRAGAGKAIELAVDELAIVGDERAGYQAAGAAALERGVEARLHAMQRGESSNQASLFGARPLAGWATHVLTSVERDLGFGLNAEQRSGALMPFEQAFSVLTGGAGVGKTTVLRAIIRLADARNLKVYQMALAGRAAKRMSESTGRAATTIAKFLSDVRSQKLDVSGDSLLVIDEASMVDLPTFYRNLRYVPDGARVLLVGDPAQLPPIGFGLVFHKLAGNSNVPQTHLVQVHRQAESTGIPAVATAVRNHHIPSLRTYEGKGQGVSFIDCAADRVMSILQRLAVDWHGEDWQALAAVKGGRGGIEFINATFHALATGEIDGPAFVAGEPLIHLVNDMERGLMNGTLGRVVRVDEAGLVGSFEGHEHWFDWSEVRERIEHAYAISVHKAQGSQFRRVAVVVGESRLLDHALVYTALTRGVEQVVFVGDRDALERAIRNPPLAHLREVGFTV
jgi:exodeoxyribonuclease V alpha subunit